MAVAAEIQVRDKLFIGGEWVDPAGSETIDVVNACTEEVMGRIPQSTPEDVDRAVKAARAAFESWSQAPLEERREAHQGVVPRHVAGRIVGHLPVSRRRLLHVTRVRGIGAHRRDGDQLGELVAELLVRRCHGRGV